MIIKELKDKTKEELLEVLNEKRREISKVSLEILKQKEKNVNKARALQKDVARIKTVLKQLELVVNAPEVKTKKSQKEEKNA